MFITVTVKNRYPLPLISELVSQLRDIMLDSHLGNKSDIFHHNNENN